ncbi:7-deoxyloganetic acid glucosyltransferase-like [Coffea eugenioides]|uniref:7-deoxyloganetic acid glucosyltransferase-like n=1 Tax=Coffea eugenioides TaxID=49369 RepID=UPI000F606928|nr:7-deoxyloganetic acid glucosyltransferase-like [Coffea eugenioides]
MNQKPQLPPHVLIFPLPLPGPVNSMLKLAELLCLAGLHITFVVTEHIHGRLLRYANIQSRFECYPGFQLKTIPDGLPEDDPRSRGKFAVLFDSLKSKGKLIFKDMLTSGCLSHQKRRPVSFIIADGCLGFTCDAANEVGIPIVYVRTVSPCCLWVFFCLPRLIEAGEIPFNGDDLDTLIKGVPGMESFLRRRDLPSFCRSGDPDDESMRLYKTEGQENSRAYGLIVNTFEDLDGPILSHMRTVCPNIYTIGPLHAHHKNKLAEQAASLPPTSNSVWSVDRSCMTWLDSQPSKSVIYVSFGSIATLTKGQLMEFWHGLVNSGVRFLWVIRPDSVTGEDWESQVPAEVREDTRRRGCIVGWAPQEEVLAHFAVGGFLTHNGWNSTVESIHAGVPMICWPYFLDQQVNSRFVSEVWKVGLDMKDTCDRATIEKMVRELMVVRNEEFSGRAEEMAQLARTCLNEGGSSYCNLERLVRDIESMTQDRTT